MKVTLIQYHYDLNKQNIDESFANVLAMLDQCDETSDVIVLPEYSDIPCRLHDVTLMHATAHQNGTVLLQKVAETAKRCHALIFCNCLDESFEGGRNTTFAIDENGQIVGKYHKTHPAPSEVRDPEHNGYGIDVSYSYLPAHPYIFEKDGIRYAFLTCYDFYFYESFARIARERPDIIIGCSHQRSDTHEALSIIGKFLCYQTNAYLVRASVSLDENSAVCGSSMVVSPKGEMLLDMQNRVGIESVEIDPHKKYEKPAGFGGKTKPHWEYIEEGRRPWLYRPGGTMMIPEDEFLPYPRICAHQGFNSVAPGNSLPAFGAAVALGAQEIEFDLWSTKDGELVSMHDPFLERVSDGTGHVWDHTLEELRQFDFGSKKSPAYAGLQIVTFEEILKKFACTVIMNIHVKIWENPAFDPQFEKIASLLYAYGCEKHAYIMSNADKAQEEFHKIAPHIHRCVGWDGTKDDNDRIVDRAIRLQCEKVQLFKPYFDQSTVDKAHANHILCNAYVADTPEEAKRFRAMGIDTILTNDYQNIARSLK